VKNEFKLRKTGGGGASGFISPDLARVHDGRAKKKAIMNTQPVKLIVMADYSHGLFLPDGATSPELLGLSQDLCAHFNAWLRLYRAPDQVPADYRRAKYNARGRRLAVEIADALRGSHQIVYRYLPPLKKSEAEWHWEEEEITGTPVIELHITAWHPCEVWKVGGGLQPGLEDLPISPKFTARLKAWRNKFDSDCDVPSYSSRKEHDEEGRVIAAELQQAVGDKNIEVIFRHWQEFDPKGWRSYWREENLFIGDCKAFWLDEDLPDELATKILRIFPDFAGSYLWDLEGCCTGVESFGGTAELDERFTKWAEHWDTCTSIEIETMETDVAALAAGHFDEKGLALAVELKRVVGDKVRVVYRFSLRKADAEILAEGSTKEWPRDTDYRQWALDQRETI